jgi:hypothetical protein
VNIVPRLASIILISVLIYLGFVRAQLWLPLAAAPLGTALYVAGYWKEMAAPFERKGVPRVLLFIFLTQTLTAYFVYLVARGASVLVG